MFYNDFRNFISFLPRFILNGLDFVEGFFNAFRVTYVDKGFWYESGYCLGHNISGWYDEFVTNGNTVPGYRPFWTWRK
jgi:hypothetical protein